MVSKRVLTAIFFVSTMILFSCSSIKRTDTPVALSTLHYQLGTTWGGIVENEKLKGVEIRMETDAITGATEWQWTIGVHPRISIFGHILETGLSYDAFSQKIKYHFSRSNHVGTRQIDLHQFRVPIQYTWTALKHKNRSELLTLRIGMSLGFTLCDYVENKGSLPEYSLDKFDYGPALSLFFSPFAKDEFYQLGMFAELYRGSKVYDDLYHSAEGMGGMSMFRVGLEVVR